MNNIKRQFQRLPLFRKTADMQKGFTLVEMMVSISIFVIMTALFTTRYSRFNEDILISNLAYDVALTIRQAQSYGLNVRETTESQGSFLVNDFSHGFGAYFQADNTRFWLFEDDGSLNYDLAAEDSQDVVLNTYNTRRNYRIQNICVVTSVECVGSGDVSILFIRPNPEPIIVNNLGQYGSMARITVSTPAGQTRDIVVRNTGQISVGR